MQDAINEGIVSFLMQEELLQRCFKPDYMRIAERALRNHLANAFAKKLKYTSDGFDATKFKRSITEEEYSVTNKLKPLLDSDEDAIDKAAKRGTFGL